MDEIEGYAFFLVPDPPEPFPGPERLQLIAESAFVQENSQQITFTLNNQGKVEEEGKDR